MSAPIRKAILPAAGLGTRLRPLSELIPKELLPVGDRVVLQHVYEECDAAGLDALLLVLSLEKLALMRVDGVTPAPADAEMGISSRRVYYAEQRLLGGLGHALLHGEAFVGRDHFAVALADSIIVGEPGALLRRMTRAHQDAGAAVTLAVRRVPPELAPRYGIVAPAGATGHVFPVTAVIEKPTAADAPSDFAVMGRYVFSPEIFAALRSIGMPATGELDLTKAMTRLAQSGRPVLAVTLAEDERRLDIGHRESYFEAFDAVQRRGKPPT